MQGEAFEAVIPFLTVLICLCLGLLVLARSQRGWVHWSFAVAIGALAIAQLGNGLSLLADSSAGLLRWRRVALVGETLMPISWLVFSLTFARSNARDLMREWRLGLAVSGILTCLFLVLAGSDAIFGLTYVPEANAHVLTLGPLGQIYTCLYLFAQVVILANLEQTLRHADEQARWYIKFPVVGLGLLCAYFLYQMSDLVLYSAWRSDLAWLSGAISGTACVLVGYGLLHRPIPDVQIYVSRRVVSGSLTFLIVGGTLAATAVVAGIIRYSGLPGSVVLSMLFMFLAATGVILFLLSASMRQTLGRFVERHFFPQKYDYRARWMEVTQAVGAPGTPEQIAWRIIQLLKGIFGPRSVSIWITTDRELDAWSRIGSHNVPAMPNRLKGEGKISSWLERQSGFCHVEHASAREKLPEALAELLDGTEATLIIPLKGGRHAIGWIALGSSADGVSYVHQDLDLLRCIAAQVADRLQHLVLADRLAMAREMEAFYQYSAFFLHDLKNFTATLSLVVQNAVRHGSNADFQRVAMSTVSATVKKMTALMGTLGALSKELHPKLVRVDLNELVADVLAGFHGAAVAKLVHQPMPVPPVHADPNQLQQVLLNLILNAQEAAGANGQVTIRTELLGEIVSLVVEDNGCGMDPTTAGGLFRPFRTTKGRGLGIGLFQCRKIIVAHHGELEVDSEVGKGSRFIIRLHALQEERVEAHA
jgi:putative PEP-CTERM system histidine kinase